MPESTVSVVYENFFKSFQASDWIALSSVAIALCVFFITIWQAWFTRRNAIINVKPAIIVSHEIRKKVISTETKTTKSETYINSFYKMENCGLGPARITTFKYFFDNEEIDQEALPLGTTRVVAILKKYLYLPNHTIISSSDYRKTSIIKVGINSDILHLKVLEKDYDELKNELNRLRIYIEYEDFFGNAQPPIE